MVKSRFQMMETLVLLERADVVEHNGGRAATDVFRSIGRVVVENHQSESFCTENNRRKSPAQLSRSQFFSRAQLMHYNDVFIGHAHSNQNSGSMCQP